MPSGEGGRIIVKGNYTPDGVLAASAVMYGRVGYSPDGDGWFLLEVLADGTAGEGRHRRGLPGLPQRFQPQQLRLHRAAEIAHSSMP